MIEDSEFLQALKDFLDWLIKLIVDFFD